MEEIIEIIEKLKTLSGNQQLDYLKSHKDNLILKEVLQYTYDTNKVYRINEAKLDKALSSLITTSDIKTSDIEVIGKDVWQEYKTDLDKLTKQKGVKELDVIRLCNKYFVHQEFMSLNLLKGVLLKDLRINMGIKLFLKVWDDFVEFKYPYMGCKSFSMKNLSALDFSKTIAQKKLDGLFCNAIVDPVNKTVEYMSRQGKPITIKGSLDESLLKIKATEKFVLNGEILVIDKETNKPYPREISNGIIRRDNKTQDELNSIIMVCWDIIPWANFIQGVYNEPYGARLMILKQVIKMAGDRIKLVDTWEVKSINEAFELFNKMYNLGEEGIVVKERDGVWKDGKPRYQVKIKNESECDLRCTALVEGNGAFENMLGAISCTSEDGLLTVDVGTGLTEENRKEFWENKDKYINKILTVKYNSKIKGDKETWSLFLPVFVEWRDLDKTIADKLEEIK